MESAPLQNNLIIPLSLTITVSLFLSEENSIKYNNSTSTILVISSPKIIFFILAASLFVK
jgi:uncharacterized protein YqkB